MKKAVVTGATKGIGKSITDFLVDSDYEVYGIARNKPEKSDFKFIEFDLSRIEDIESLVKKLPDEVDLLVNNAGIANKIEIKEIEYNYLQDIFRVNLFSHILLTKHLLDRFSDEAKVVNISSDVSEMSIPGYTAYAGTKAAMNIFTATLANEHKDIEVYSLLPTLVNTEKTAGHSSTGYDTSTFLDPSEIGIVLRKIFDGEYQSGDMIVVTNNKWVNEWKDRNKYLVYNVDEK